MAKYIDAERALFVVKGLRGPTRSPAQNEMIRRAIDGIERLPAADVAPVRHGRWVLIVPGQTTSALQCSECGRRITVHTQIGNLEKDYPYCHCGAKMDGE